jgi:hypothetical protein
MRDSTVQSVARVQQMCQTTSSGFNLHQCGTYEEYALANR